MKILVASYIGFDELPPAISFVKALVDEGIEVVFLSYYKLESYASLFGKHFTCYSALDSARPDSSAKLTTTQRILRSIYWRFIRSWHSSYIFSRLFNKIYSSQSFDQIWILHECTAKMLFPAIKKTNYSIVVYELEQSVLDGTDKAGSRAIKAANKIVVPEFCRGEILRTYLGLRRRPYCIPNKPIFLEEKEGSDDAVDAIRTIQQIRNDGYTILLYSGIIIPERKLELVVEATRRSSIKCKLVVMGQRTGYLNALLSKYGDAFVYLGFVSPPSHLNVIKNADIGVVVYVPTAPSLNALFCAPNKIWEYAGCGVPMLANDVPGLLYTVQASGSGVCFNSDSLDDAVRALEELAKNKENYREQAKTYFQSVDVRKLIVTTVRS